MGDVGGEKETCSIDRHPGAKGRGSLKQTNMPEEGRGEKEASSGERKREFIEKGDRERAKA